MAALGVDAQLRLVDRGEGEVADQTVFGGRLIGVGHRHGFDGAQDVARVRRDDALLAGQQGDPAFALHRDDAVVNFAGEEAQREADHAAGMGAHPLDREMRLAGVGRAKDRLDVARLGTGHGVNVARARQKRKAMFSLARPPYRGPN